MNARNLRGWAIGAAVGLVTFVLLFAAGGLGFFPAAVLGVIVAIAVALFLGWLLEGASAEPALTGMAEKPTVESPVANKHAPAAEVAAEPVAVVSAPADTAPKPAAKPKSLGKPKSAAKPKPGPRPSAAAVEAAVEPVAFLAPTAPKAAAKPKAAEKSAAGAGEPAAEPKASARAKAGQPAVKAAKPSGPTRLKAARKGKADDLKEIEGIGPALEKLVNSLGFYHFDQIAGWSDADVALVDAEMKTFKGRIARDKWVAQAKIIVSEGLEAFRERAKTNDY